MSVSFGDTPKSILKPTSKSGQALPSPAEARRIALSHATSLQIRKVLEASALDSLVHLIDFPLHKPSPALQPHLVPARRDVRAFKFHLRFFTPGDYDDLIEERNIVDRCGYALCANPRRKKKFQSRLARVAGGDWIDKKELEKFCGDECARRALWVRVQLDSEPAWMRGQVVDGAIVDEDTGKVSGV